MLDSLAGPGLPALARNDRVADRHSRRPGLSVNGQRQGGGRLLAFAFDPVLVFKPDSRVTSRLVKSRIRVSDREAK
jgi:hypothetical protein